VFTNKNGGFTVTQTDVFINQFTTYFSPGYHEAILEECTNGDRMQINFVLVL
jgi:hypothetical protein